MNKTAKENYEHHCKIEESLKKELRKKTTENLLLRIHSERGKPVKR
jgi:hypothetical protein